MMQAGRIKPAALVTQSLPLEEAVRAFDLASDRNAAIKVQLAFDGATS